MKFLIWWSIGFGPLLWAAPSNEMIDKETQLRKQSSQQEANKATVNKRKLSIGPREFERRIEENFPAIRNLLLGVEMAQAKILEAEGSFDTKLNAGVDDRDGYYKSEASAIGLKKKMQFQGIEVSGGWREGTGRFPSYEDAQTAAGGESFIKLDVPLLRGGRFDPLREKLRVAELELESAQAALRDQSLIVRAEALKTYWETVMLQTVRGSLLELKEVINRRQALLEKKAKAGSLADILLRENYRNLIQVEEQVVALDNEIQLALNKLSFFLFLDAEDPPEIQLQGSALQQGPRIELQAEMGWLDRHPRLLQLDYAIEQAKVNLRRAENNLLPDLNLVAQHTQVPEPGTEPLTQTETKLGVNFEFPLMQSKARGERGVAQAKIAMSNNKRSEVRSKLLQEYRNLVDTLMRMKRQLDLVREQVAIDKELRDSEELLFLRGNSNLINLNIRERNLLRSQIKEIELLAKLQKLKVEFGVVVGKNTLSQ